MWNLQDVARHHIADINRWANLSGRGVSRRKARRALGRSRQLASEAATSRGQLAA